MTDKPQKCHHECVCGHYQDLIALENYKSDLPCPLTFEQCEYRSRLAPDALEVLKGVPMLQGQKEKIGPEPEKEPIDPITAKFFPEESE